MEGGRKGWRKGVMSADGLQSGIEREGQGEGVCVGVCVCVSVCVSVCVFALLAREGRMIALLHRAKLSSGDNMLKKAFLLLSDSRSPNLTRSQLRASCLSRLNVFFQTNKLI